MLPLRSRRCGAPLPNGGSCMRRELHVDNMKCAHHGGTGELARIVRKKAKDTRKRDALAREAQAFVARMRAAGHLPPKAGV